MQVFCDLIGDLKSDISPTHVTKMLLRTPDPPHTCGGLGTRLGALLEKQGREIWKWNRNRNMKSPYFLGFELLICHCYTFSPHSHLVTNDNLAKSSLLTLKL